MNVQVLDACAFKRRVPSCFWRGLGSRWPEKGQKTSGAAPCDGTCANDCPNLTSLVASKAAAISRWKPGISMRSVHISECPVGDGRTGRRGCIPACGPSRQTGVLECRRGSPLARATLWGAGSLVAAVLTGAQVSAWKRRRCDGESTSGAHWRPAWLIRLSDVPCSKSVSAFRFLDPQRAQMCGEC